MENIDQDQVMTDGLPLEGEDVVSEDQPSRLQKFLIEVLETVVLALIMFGLINFSTARIRVDGPSMEPTFLHNNYVIVSKMSYRLGAIDRGEVMVFHFPRNPEEDYIKRVIALEGDTVRIRNGNVIVNGEKLDEPYIKDITRRDHSQITVEPGNVYVMGDNRNNSSDSRSWGNLPVENVLGKAILIYWPFTDFGVVEHLHLALLKAK
ncbi:MAG: signal peptidase I [Chloroflexota bacterium]